MSKDIFGMDAMLDARFMNDSKLLELSREEAYHKLGYEFAKNNIEETTTYLYQEEQTGHYFDSKNQISVAGVRLIGKRYRFILKKHD